MQEKDFVVRYGLYVNNGLLVVNTDNDSVTITGTMAVNGDLSVSGNLIAAGLSPGDLIPPSNSLYNLGNTTHTWLSVYGQTLVLGNSTVNVVANSTVLSIGNTSVNSTINSTSFSGTSANATNLNSQPGSYYTNATNLATGTVPDARLPKANSTANGIVMLVDSLTNTSVTHAAAANAIPRLAATVTANASAAFTNAAARADAAFTNATAFASNADNISSGTLSNARLNPALSVANLTLTTNLATIGSAHLFAANGNVGIGNTTPTSRLVVTGTVNVISDSAALRVGNSSVFVITNSSSFSGTSNNATNLDGNPSSYYTNATNLTTGTVANARLPSSGLSTAGIVQLVDSLTNTSVTIAAAANAIPRTVAFCTDVGNMSAGILPIVRGGTGANTQAGARTSLGITLPEEYGLGSGNTGGDSYDDIDANRFNFITNSSAIGVPSGFAFHTITTRRNTANRTQIALGDTTSAAYYRRTSGGTWQSWLQFMFGSNNLSEITNSTTARQNIGAHDASNLSTGTLASGRLSGTYTINITGNASGSAGTLNGFVQNASSQASSIVLRDSNADIAARWFTGAYVQTTDDAVSSGVSSIMVKTSGDFHRSASNTAVQTFLGLGTGVWFSAGNRSRIQFVNNNTTWLSGGNSSQVAVSIRASNALTTNVIEFYGNGAIVATGDVTGFSDSRLKENIEVISDPWSTIDKISGYSFEWNSEGKKMLNTDTSETLRDVGFIAQEFGKVVTNGSTVNPLSGDKKYLTVKPEKILPYMIEAMKDLKKRIRELELRSS